MGGEDPAALRAGAGRALITPAVRGERPVYLAGFGPNRVATQVHDDLYARALALSAGDTGLLLVTADVIGFQGVVVQELLDLLAPIAARAAIPRTHIMIVATHNHQGPDTLGLWGPSRAESGVDAAIMERIAHGLAAAATQAVGMLAPARLRAGAVPHVAGVVYNARDPEILDDALVALQVAGAEPIATLVNFANHPEALGEQNTALSTDFVAALCATVEREFGGIALFLPGALGGMMTPNVTAHTFAEAERVGRTLGEAAVAALAVDEWQERPVLVCRKRRVALAQANPLFSLALEAGLLRPLAGITWSDAEEGRAMLESEVNHLVLGPAEFITVPGELLPALGLEIKAAMMGTVRGIVGLANDEIGYILPAEVFVYPKNPEQPGDHYEETMSLGRETGPAIMAAVRALLAPGSAGA
jgi:hypothetical protein